MLRPGTGTNVCTWGALVLAVGFVVATIMVVAKVIERQERIESCGRAITRFNALQSAVHQFERFVSAESDSDEAMTARLARMVDDCELERRAIEGRGPLAADLEEVFRKIDAGLLAVRRQIPEQVRTRREPEATRQGVKSRLDAITRTIEEEIADGVAVARKLVERESLEMRASTQRATVLLILACVLAVVVGVLLLLRQRDMSRLLAERRERDALGERLDVVLESVPAVLWSVDRDLRITASHGAALRDMGLEPGQVVGQTLQEYFGVDDRSFEPISRHFRALEGKAQRYEFTWAGRTFLTLLVPLKPRDGGEPEGVLGVGFDVTELKEAERALADSHARVRHLEKMEAIGRLADTIAHDFNNFLTVMLGNAGLALAALPKDSPVRGEIEEIERTAERAAQLTRQLLAFSRPAAAESEPVDVNASVRGLEPILRRQCGPSIELALRLSTEPAVVAAHPAEIEQIVLNLVLNARDAMPQGGRLTISTRPSPRRAGHVELAVADTGIGIPDDVRARLFEPFFTTKAASGTGLGLAIVDAVVRERGGSVSVESALQRGSTFRVELPAAASLPVAEAAGPPPPVPSGRGETVLVVEDDESVRSLTRRALEANGYQVIEARGGEEAMAVLAARKGQVELMITDRRMPRMSGKSLTRWCREHDAVKRILVMSTHREGDEAGEAAELGELPFLGKPFTSSELLRRVREALDGAPTR